MRRWIFLIPLLIFFVVVGFLAQGLFLDPREVPSPLIDKPVPAFTLPTLHLEQADEVISPDYLKGQIYLLNVWASWCQQCLVEHPFFLQLSQYGVIPIYGFNYKDERSDGLAWLQQHGNPYTAVAFDYTGRVGLDLGVYGAPETFLIDKQGIIRYKHIGPVTPDAWSKEFAPRIKTLQEQL
ncbi:MAG: DsbE family thiol:disulfide interchange protein [Gammaproteobacteria bacterium]|nr:DsbE family thiol:disulfide interchange protein [Gammaproteobacteria bacterium]